jgi:GR25 family glycosyltransferase involved in LPS biosynthesis
VISVPGCDRRRASAEAQLTSIDWPFQFVDGHAPGRDTAAAYSPALNRRHAKRPLTPGEIAVYTSHRRALRTFLDSRRAVGLILEDDFCLLAPSSFRRSIAAILNARVKWDLIKLFDYGARRVVQRHRADDWDIVNYAAPTAGMVAYLITRRGAELILSRPRLFRQIDEDTKHYWELSIRVYSASPNLVGEISDCLGGSLLHAEREKSRCERSLGRSVKGLWLVANRKLRHHWHKSRYGIEPLDAPAGLGAPPKTRVVAP